MSDSENILSVTNAIVKRGAFTLGPIELGIARSAKVGLIGPSGSGKSTFLRSLALIEPFLTGQMNFEYDSVNFSEAMSATEFEAVRRMHAAKFAYVGQNIGLWPHLSVLKNITLARYLTEKGSSKSFKAEVKEVSEALGISSLLARKTWEISGGEARRVGVARALMMSPKVIIIDEIDAGLDPLRLKRTIEATLSICDHRGMSVLFASHNIPIISKYTDYLYVLNQGKIVESGPTTEVVHNPKNEVTRELIETFRV